MAATFPDNAQTILWFSFDSYKMALKIMDGSLMTLNTLEVTYAEIGMDYSHIQSIDGVRYTGAGESYWSVWTQRMSFLLSLRY